jgi:hypothetical protein
VAVLGLHQVQIPDHVQGTQSESLPVVSVRRVESQAMCLRSVESQSSGLACRQGRFGRTDFRNVDRDMSAVVVGAVAVAVAVAVAEIAAEIGFVADGAAVVAVATAVAVAVVVVGLFPVDLRDNRLALIASTFYVVSCPKTIQSGLKSFAWSE